MFFKYGSYQHPDNEAKLMAYMVRPQYSPRGKQAFVIGEMHVQIEVVLPTGTIYTTTTAQQYLNGRITEIIAAYENDYQDAKFCHDDGTPTKHSLDNATSISGVQIKHRTWPRGDAAEYATTRTGYVVLQATYINLYSELYSYSEIVRSIGTGAPRWRVQEQVVGAPVGVYLNQQTVQKVIQAGQAVGVEGYPLPFINPLWPQYEHQDIREVTPGHPQQFGQGWALYPISWAFHFTLPVAQNSIPILT